MKGIQDTSSKTLRQLLANAFDETWKRSENASNY